MPPKKLYQSTTDNNWQSILTILLVVLIILIGFLIYLLYYKNNNMVNNTTEKIVYISGNNQTPSNADNIPVYPKQLPKYNNPDYQQVGILTANETDKDPIILPLFARKLRNHNDRWQYYTATDKNNMMRLPIKHENKNCDDEIGCREIYEGDTLTIEIYQGRIFTASIYKNDIPQYFADIY